MNPLFRANFGVCFFVTEMATKQYIAIKKTPLTNIDQKLENSSLIDNLIKITLPMRFTLKNTIKYQ
jgi:hypothetical protein